MLTVDNPKTFDWAGISLVDCAEGNAADAYFTLKLFSIFEEKLEELGLVDLYESLISPITEVFAEMEYAGLPVSREKLKEVGRELMLKNVEAEDSLYTSSRMESTDNISSNNDLIEILYTRESGFCLYPPDKTAKSNPSVSAPTLKILLEHIDAELVSRERS